MQAFPIRALAETDFDGIVEAAGGSRAHPDADRREEVGADYVLGTTVIELKLLDEEGFGKPERQAKLAALFRETQPNRPVVVLDEEMLPLAEHRKYLNTIAEPVKRVIAKAPKQLVQTRSEKPETTGSVLWIFNNGYTALDHETLEALAAMRVDLDEIWAQQSMPDALASFVETIVAHAHEHVTNPPGGQNVTEWCKKEKCWEIFREQQISVPAAVEAGLLSREKGNTRKKPEALGGVLSKKDQETIDAVATVPSETWFGLSAWAKDTNNLQPWQRSLSFSLGKLARASKQPSRKQAEHGEKILAEARRLGFRA